MVLSSCCLAGRSALPLEPGDGGHRGMPRGHRGQATEPTKSAPHGSELLTCRSAQEPGWLVGACGWGSGMPAPSGQLPPPWAWWENEAPATRTARSPSQAALAWLSSGEEQVAVQAEEVLSVAPELAEVLGPGVGLVTGEAALGDGVVGHDLAVGDAVGVGVVLRVEQNQGLGMADLEPGSLELVTKCAGQVWVGEPCPPCI